MTYSILKLGLNLIGMNPDDQYLQGKQYLQLDSVIDQQIQGSRGGVSHFVG